MHTDEHGSDRIKRAWFFRSVLSVFICGQRDSVGVAAELTQRSEEYDRMSGAAASRPARLAMAFRM